MENKCLMCQAKTHERVVCTFLPGDLAYNTNDSKADRIKVREEAMKYLKYQPGVYLRIH